MNKIKDRLNGNRFIPVDGEEKTALELIKKVITKSNDVIEQVNIFESEHNSVKETVNSFDKKVELYNKNVNEYKEFVEKLPEINANAEVLDARCGKNTLGEFNRSISEQLETKASKSEIGTPLIASSVSEMTDTTKVYVNTTDGNWYSWNGIDWVIGGVYNSQGIGDKEITPNKTNFFDEVVNLFNYETLIDGKFITDNTEHSATDYYCSDFIPVEPGATYIMPYNVNNCGCMYNENKEFVGNIKRNNITQPSTEFTIFKVGLATYWVKVNGYKGNYEGRTSRQPSEYMLIKGTEYPEDYLPFNNYKPYLKKESMNKNIIKEVVRSEILNNSINYLEGKVLACAGDSITYGANADLDSDGNPITYGYLTAKRNNMTYLNYGVSGSTLTNNGASKAFTYDRYSKMADNIDYLTIFFGWNDFAYCNLGTIDDTQNNTFYGAWNFVLPYLIKKYPKTKIGLIVPYGTNAEWRNAVRLVAKKWGLPYLDLMSESTPLFFEKEYEVNAEIIALRKSTFLADAVHPNNIGYEYLSTIFENWLRSL